MSAISAISSTLVKRTVPLCSVSKTTTSIITTTPLLLSLNRNPWFHTRPKILVHARVPDIPDQDLTTPSPPEFSPPAPGYDRPSTPTEVPGISTTPEIDPIFTPPEVSPYPDPNPGPDFPVPPLTPPPVPDNPIPGPDVLPPQPPDVVPPPPTGPEIVPPAAPPLPPPAQAGLLLSEV